MTEVKLFSYKYNKAIYGELVYECDTLREFLETATEDKFVQQEFEDYDIDTNQFLADGDVIVTPDTIEVTVYGQVVTFRRIAWGTYVYESCTL